MAPRRGAVSYARAAIMGMNRDSGKAHIARAALECIAYQVRDAVELMHRESGILLQELRADGGASDNVVLMQFQADMLERQVVKSEVTELSAMGSVYLGALAVGFWLSQEEIAAQARPYRYYIPQMEPDRREKFYAGWRQAVSAVLQHGPQSQADI